MEPRSKYAASRKRRMFSCTAHAPPKKNSTRTTRGKIGRARMSIGQEGGKGQDDGTRRIIIRSLDQDYSRGK
jgi:hypothetical protein